MRFSKFVPLCLACLLAGSCASIVKGSYSSVALNSQPQGAQVYVNGHLMGETPVRLKLKSRHTYAIEFRKEGYPTKTVTVKNHLAAGWIVLDALFGLVPLVLDAVIVDVTTGSWYQLNQKNIDIVLEKEQPRPGTDKRPRESGE